MAQASTLKGRNMLSRKLGIPAGIVVCLVCVALAQKPEPKAATAEQADSEQTAEKPKPKNPNTLEAFMRKKLTSSSKILEGLCQEDMSLVKEGADELSAMSRVELWNVLVDPEFREYSRDYFANAARVSEAAQEGDFDKAALRWFDVTMSCLECHEHVRAERNTEKAKKALDAEKEVQK